MYFVEKQTYYSNLKKTIMIEIKRVELNISKKLGYGGCRFAGE